MPNDDSPSIATVCLAQTFVCGSLADSYRAMGEYARSLRRDVLIECNPAGVGPCIMSTPDGERLPVDHGRCSKGARRFGPRVHAPGYHDGKLHTRIRTYKVARSMGNMAFTYTNTPLEMAESMAFNSDCLGCVCFLRVAELRQPRRPRTNPSRRSSEPYIRFFHQRRNLLRGAEVVADVAVLRSFPSQVFGGTEYSAMTARVEDMLIGNRDMLPDYLRSSTEQVGSLPGSRAGRLRSDGRL